ncbi:hypothetical protein JCM21900_001244, partial [Sporobolomyces salmonicolor]
PAWAPETLYRWDIKPPPVSSAVPPLDAPADLISTADEAVPPKRAREETSELELTEESGTKRGKGQVVVDEDEERPADAFNPLLFRALQGVARRLAQERIIPVHPSRVQLLLVPPAPPPRSFTASPASSIPPPPRSSLPSISRPDPPSLLSRSTTKAPPTLNLSALLSDLSVLSSQPSLFGSATFQVVHEDDASAPKKPKRTLVELESGELEKDELRRENAAELVDQWLERQGEVLKGAEAALSEKQGEGKSGRLSALGSQAQEVEDGLLGGAQDGSATWRTNRLLSERHPTLPAPTPLSNRLWRVPLREPDDSTSAIPPCASTTTAITQSGVA